MPLLATARDFRPQDIPTHFKDDPALVTTELAPRAPLPEPPGGAAAQHAIIRLYNQLGGLMEALSQRTGISVPALLAVWMVESGGRRHTPGRAVLRFEAHHLFRHWGRHHEALFDAYFRFGGRGNVDGRAWENHAFRECTAENFRPYHGNQDSEYRALAIAIDLAGEEIALRCASIGGPQILMSHHALLGYDTAGEMHDAFQRDERAHVLGFFDYCALAVPPPGQLIEDLRERRWTAFARGYNGPGQAEHYGELISRRYRLARALLEG
jgi:hypothetical protein